MCEGIVQLLKILFASTQSSNDFPATQIFCILIYSIYKREGFYLKKTTTFEYHGANYRQADMEVAVQDISSLTVCPGLSIVFKRFGVEPYMVTLHFTGLEISW